MIHAFVYLLIGAAVSYFMQPQIQWIAENITKVSWLQTATKIFLDALLSLTWIVGAPAILIAKSYLKKRNENDEKS